MKKKYDYNLTLEECLVILDNIKGLVVVDENKKVKFLSEDMIDRILRLGNEMPENGPTGASIEQVHPSSKITRGFELSEEKDLLSVYVFNGQPNVARIKPVYQNGKIRYIMDYDLLYGYDDIKSFLAQADKLLWDLEDMKRDYLAEKNERKKKYHISDIIGNSDQIVELKQKIYNVAETESTVLITGETGCGKEMVAQSIHYMSRRSKFPFVEINCATIPENLAESEFFGYEEGSFTGAIKGGRLGKFEMANKGTIFLDEIDQLSYHLQPKLLRVLQEREISRIGGQAVPVNVRVIAATNKNLKGMVEKGLFREDLYYRLNVIEIPVPSLRERKEDIPLLANAHLKKIENLGNKHIETITDEAMKLLMNYSWPGNVRELFNIIERGVHMSAGEELELTEFREMVRKEEGNRAAVVSETEGSLEDIRKAAEKNAIIRALELCGNNRSKAAAHLKITRQGLHRKMNQYGIQ